MDDLIAKINNYIPFNEQEENDKKMILQFIGSNNNCLDRSNETAHLTASAWIVNKARTKCLFVYHKIYDSWSWVGGHADGNANLSEVALKETAEETGVKNAKLVSDDILSLEILTVDGHVKKGKYVSSHLHLNLTYLIEADESEMLKINPDENTGVRWFTFDDALSASTEPWMIERIYKKLIAKSR